MIEKMNSDVCEMVVEVLLLFLFYPLNSFLSIGKTGVIVIWNFQVNVISFFISMIDLAWRLSANFIENNFLLVLVKASEGRPVRDFWRRLSCFLKACTRSSVIKLSKNSLVLLELCITGCKYYVIGRVLVSHCLA